MTITISLDDLKKENYENVIFDRTPITSLDSMPKKKLSNEQAKTVAEFLFNVLVKEKK